ncbi:MAG: hypothetical protein KAF40_01245 [Flavihumibacter sp.]|nr:hypothetical protein [Flavihumibacter sp.]
MAELTRKQAQQAWDEFREAIIASTPVDRTETITDKRKRIAHLEANPEEWFKYYFPKYSYSEPAEFHKRATKRILGNPEWFEVRSWSRELAKSTRTMFEVLYLVLTGKKRYVLLVSNSKDNADTLLEPYRIELDSNQRIINDYGTQTRVGRWNIGEFTTKQGVKFKAIGAGQSPRGTRNEERRPDVLLFDDLDTDEDCRNPDTIKNKWNWIEKAAIGTRSISMATLILFCGNIIAKDCCVVRAQKYADKVDIVNIRDNEGKSTWPQKNSEAHIDRVLKQKSYAAGQGEYFNNPITEGNIFKEMYYKILPSLKAYKFLVCYIDLSYKSGAKNDFKAAALVGKLKDEYHIHKAVVRQATTSRFAEGLVEIEKYVAGVVPVFYVAEENFMQDIIRKELHENLKSLGSKINITPDTRDKGDKITRIEAALEPLNRNGKLWLSLKEKTNPDMAVLDGQFIGLEYGNKRVHDDAPDAVEGAKFIIDSKIITGAEPPRAGRVAARKHRL